MTDETTETQTDEEFDAAWNEATTDSDAPPSVEEEEEVEAPEEEAPEEELPAEEEPTPVPEKDWKTETARLEQALRSMEGRYRADRERWSQQATQRPQPAPQPTDDEDQFLQKFAQDYNDDVLKAVQIVAKREANTLVSQQLTRLAPVESSMEVIQEQLHFQAIEAVHPDVSEINESPEFDAWIASRPAHLRSTYEYIREQGKPHEVISMLDEYKDFHQPPSPNPVSASKVASATVVKSRRGALPTRQGPDSDDFDAAWEEATRSKR